MKYLMLTSVVSFQLETTLSGLNVISASNNGHTAIAISPNQANTVHVIIFGTDGLHTTSAQSTVQSVKSFDLIGSSPVFITAFKTHQFYLSYIHLLVSIYVTLFLTSNLSLSVYHRIGLISINLVSTKTVTLKA